MPKESVRILVSSGAMNQPCSRCGGKDWDVNQRRHLIHIQDTPGEFKADKYVPVIMVVCRSCGHLTLYARTALGLE